MSTSEEDRRWVLVPIEVKAREFESRVLLSCFIAEAGYGVILGKQSTLYKHIKHLPRGLFFDKSISANKLERIKKRTNLGNLTVCIDEEGLGANLNDFYARTRVSYDTLKQTSILYAWGEQYREMIAAEYPDCAEKIIATGNPRVDLWREEFLGIHRHKMAELESRYGKYILIPSNFSAAINAIGIEFLLKRSEKYGRLKTKEDEEHFSAYVEHTRKNLDKFADAIPVISESFPDHTVIIRPHHAEDQSYWHAIANSCKNVEVTYEGGVTPWIAQAEALVHHGCTTGVEAYVLGVPAISYQPHRNERFDNRLSNQINQNVFSIDELISVLGLALKGKYKVPDDAGRIAKLNMASLEGSFAAQNMVESFSLIQWPADKLAFPVNRIRMQQKIKQAGKSITGLFTRASNLSGSHGEDSQKIKSRIYSKQKFPGSSLQEISALIDGLRDSSGYFKGVEARELCENLYCIEKQD